MRRMVQPILITGIIVAIAFAAKASILAFLDSLLLAYIIGFGVVLAGGYCISLVWKDVVVSKSETQRLWHWGGAALGLYGMLLCLRAFMIFKNYGQFIDLSYYESAVSQLASFSLPKIWDIGSPLWSQHFEPILFLFVPFYWIGLGGSALLVWGQAILAVSSAYFLYRIALLRGAKQGAALGITALYLTAGGLQSAYLYGFHPIAVFPFFFLWAVFLYEQKKYVWYIAMVLLALFVKEEISFVVIAWGLWLLFGRKDVYRGILSIGLGALWYGISFGLIAYFHHGGYEYWGQFGGGSGRGVFGIIWYALTHPIPFIGQFFDDPRKIPMLIEIFASFALLPFFAPLSLLMLIPSLLLKLLSHDISMMNSFHYSAEITPLLALSSLEGLMVLTKRTSGVRWGILCAAIALLANSYYGFAFYYRTYAFRFGAFGISDFLQTPHSAVIDRMLTKIPKEASVSCEYAICSHIARPYGKKLPIPHKTVLDYAILDPSNPSVLVDEATYRGFVETKLLPNYTVVDQEDHVILLTVIR